jgi:hypothetical protein
MSKLFIIACFSFLPLGLLSQDFGYFGKKNIVGIHGTWFFRAVPQYFHPEKMYRFDEVDNVLKNNVLRNYVWHSGFSYRRIVNKSNAIGVQAEFYSRNLGDPIHDKLNKLNYQADWALQGNSLQNFYAWSDELQKAIQMWDLNITPTSINVLDVKVVWSRTRTMSVLPLGLVSTWGLGFQNFSVNLAKSIYASGFTFDSGTGETSVTRETVKLNSAPNGLVNNYWGLGWMWDLSLNYALNKSWLLSFGSDIRGAFLVQQSAKNSDMQVQFPNSTDGIPTLAGMVHGRNMSSEIRKEMVFQNTFRLGLLFAF